MNIINILWMLHYSSDVCNMVSILTRQVMLIINFIYRTIPFKMKSGMDYDNPLQVVKSSMSVSDQNTRYLFLAHGYMKKH